MLLESKRSGASDEEIAKLWNVKAASVRARRKELGVQPVFKRVDTCAAEFESFTPYLYSTYEEEDESFAVDRPKVVILGSGPNRIGQGIEFDYCCCHAAFALKEDGYETVMVNCNPETVSTDYDTSDRLYFEPLTLEDVLAILDKEKPQGVIVQFGGQTPLNLALALKQNGAQIIGTDPESIDLAEDRKRFGALLNELKIPQPRRPRRSSRRKRCASPLKSACPFSSARVTCSAAAPMVIAYDLKTVEEYVAQAALIGGLRSQAPDPDRPVPRRCHRSRRRCARRRRRSRHRRDHGTHRRGRHSLRRLFLRATRGHRSSPLSSIASAITPRGSRKPSKSLA